MQLLSPYVVVVGFDIKEGGKNYGERARLILACFATRKGTPRRCGEIAADSLPGYSGYECHVKMFFLAPRLGMNYPNNPPWFIPA